MESTLLTEALDPHEQQLIMTALTVLETKHNINGRLLDRRSRLNGDIVGATFEVGNAFYDYQVECKNHIDRKNILLHVKHQLKEKSPQSLLITTYLSAELADFCKEIGLQFIDLAGNAYLEAPGFYVYVKGQKGDINQTKPLNKRSVSTVTAMKMHFALLCNPQLVNASYRDIAKEANIPVKLLSQHRAIPKKLI